MRFAYGIDLKAGGVAVAVVSAGSGNYISHREFYVRKPKAKQKVQVVPRFAEVRDMTEGFLGSLAASFPPSIILVENPVGRRRVPTLVGAWGIATAAAEGMFPGQVVTLSSRQWRAKLGLPTVKGDPKGPSLAWALDHGCPAGASEDVQEAVAMAAAAGRLPWSR